LALSSGDTITTIEEKPIFPESVILAYELRTGFLGLGDFLEKHGKITILRGEHANV
jgi:hypothetical protein